MGLSLNEVVMTVGAVNPLITNLPLFIILATIPFNLIKVALNYFLGYLLYDKMKDLRMFKGGMPAC